MRPTTSSEPLGTPQDGLARWQRVPLRKRAAIHVWVWWNGLLRHRLFPMLPPDSLMFQSVTVARTLWYEARSLVGRIRFQLGSRTQFYGMTDLPYLQASTTGSGLLNLGSYARSEGIESTLAKFPWVSSGDELMYLAGWNRAEEWHRYMTSTAGREMVQASQNLTDPDEMEAMYSRMIAESKRQKVEAA